MGSDRSWHKGHTSEDVQTVVMRLVKRRGSHFDKLERREGHCPEGQRQSGGRAVPTAEHPASLEEDMSTPQAVLAVWWRERPLIKGPDGLEGGGGGITPEGS